MTDFYIELLASEDDALTGEARPGPSVLVKEYNDGSAKRCYLHTSQDVDPTPNWPASTVVLAAFDEVNGLQLGQSYSGDNVVGTPTYPIDQNYWDFVRPLGNESGQATGPLRTLRWQGHPEERYAEAVSVTQRSEYPTTNTPFTLQIERQDYGSDALPWDTNTVYAQGDFATSGGMWRSLQDNNQGNTPFGGSAFWEFINQSGPWGWVVFMISDDPARDITARAISQHSATPANDGNFLFTTGAFINDGKYGDVFYTECPPGNRDTAPDPVYFALRLGAGYEGYFTLEAPQEGTQAEALFWSADQP